MIENIDCRQLIEEAPVGVYKTRFDGSWIYANPALAHILGYESVEKLRKVPVPDFYADPRQREHLLELLQESDRINNFELELKRRDRKHISCLLNARRSGETLSGMIIDITDRRRAQEALEESEKELREIFAHLQEGLYRIDEHGKILFVNQQMADMLGFETPGELIGRDIFEMNLWNEETLRDMAEELVESGSIQNRQYTLHTLDGQELIVRENSHVIRDSQGGVKYYEGTVEDITRQKQLEESSQRNERMQALGRIAGGIAHDFNNVMATISGAAQMLQSGLYDEPDRYLEMILSSITRAKSITNRIQTFTQDRDPDMEVLSLRSLIIHVRDILSHTLAPEIEISTALFQGQDRVRTDPGYLQQVLLNVCINAADAMEGGGELRIALDEVASPAPATRIPDDNQKYLQIRVEDTGKGMSEETVQHAFDPFYTTKPSGSGLGLSVSHQLIHRLGGWIELESTPGLGTIVFIGIPRTSEPATETDADIRSESRLIGQGEHILLVEDENALRGLLAEELHRNGYRVSVAASGNDALAVYRDIKTPLNLVITDIRMEGIDGKELMSKLRKYDPHLPMIAFTGTPDNELTDGPAESTFQAVLQKPVETRKLLKTVRETLRTGE